MHTIKHYVMRTSGRVMHWESLRKSNKLSSNIVKMKKDKHHIKCELYDYSYSHAATLRHMEPLSMNTQS